MPAAPHPENEAQRLEDLKSYNILDTLPEEAYDKIVTLASFICDTPISLVSLVDEHRQWFKAKTGIEADSTSRDYAFCAHALLNPDDVLVVEDATKDPRFSDNPLVLQEPNIRFYAGAPLKTPTGTALGTLCVIAPESKKITQKQIDGLKILGDNVIALLELRKAHAQQKILIEQLQDSNENLEQFAHVASHDLQQPIRQIQYILEMIQEDFSEPLGYAFTNHIELATSSLTRMQKLIEDLLSYASLKHETPLLEDVKSTDVVEDVLHDLTALIEEKNGTVTYDSLPIVHTSESGLRQVLQNLISNALKYCPTTREPKIHISAQKESSHWVFSVKDNGLGIKQEHIDKIFAPFQRLGEVKHEVGTGIGLTGCKKIVHRWNGNIWATSEEGKGSTFSFTIPY